jgi:uncharacterized protein with PIN domain
MGETEFLYFFLKKLQKICKRSKNVLITYQNEIYTQNLKKYEHSLKISIQLNNFTKFAESEFLLQQKNRN